MADINLKTLTPDTSLPTTGFLFGADSQASTNPSVYSTQTVATTLLGSTSLTGGPALTASAPVLDLTQEWSNNAVTFTGIRYNVTNTNSAAASLLMDLQVGGTSKFSVKKDGIVNIPQNTGYTVGTQNCIYGSYRNGAPALYTQGVEAAEFYATAINIPSASGLTWANGARLGSVADRNIRIGQADAATALAQTLSVQSVVAGTSNTAGAAFTINGSQGTGTGAGGSLIFQVAPAGGSGTAQNTLLTGLTVNADRTISIGGGAAVIIRGTNNYLEFANTNNAAFIFYGNGYASGLDAFVLNPAISQVAVRSGGSFSWSNQSTYANGTMDTIISRAAAGIVQVGTTANNASGTLKAAVVGTTTAYTVATLPTGFQGARAFVTDATLPTYLGTLTGGGAVVCPVFYNGSAWVSA
jgi:hypothetical protein